MVLRSSFSFALISLSFSALDLANPTVMARKSRRLVDFQRKVWPERVDGSKMSTSAEGADFFNGNLHIFEDFDKKFD